MHLTSLEGRDMKIVQGLLADSYDYITDHGFNLLFNDINNNNFSIPFDARDLILCAKHMMFFLCL
jgi:hypothetical protein